MVTDLGGLSPVGISIFISGNCPKSPESCENTSVNSSHRPSNAVRCSGDTSASLNFIGGRGSTSAGEVINPSPKEETIYLPILHLPKVSQH